MKAKDLKLELKSFENMKLKKGDTVKILRGKDRGRTGKIEKILPKKGKVFVEGINLCKKHVKPQGKDKPGGIVEINKPLPIANVMLVCPKCSKPTRVGFEIQGKEKVRVCKKCGVNI